MASSAHETSENRRNGTYTRRQFLSHTALIIGGLALTDRALAAMGVRTLIPAQAAAEPAIQTSMLSLNSTGSDLPAYLARPTGRGPFPGIVVLHEWWGLDENIKVICQLLAAQGYMALAPDLFRGNLPESVAQVGSLVDTLNVHQTLGDAQAAISMLSAHEDTQSSLVGIMAFSFSDRLAVSIAQRAENVATAVVVYGSATPQSSRPVDETIYNYQLMPFPAPARSAGLTANHAPILILNPYSAPGGPAPDVLARQWESALDWLKQHLG
jgi:dienelactone hydrolase